MDSISAILGDTLPKMYSSLSVVIMLLKLVNHAMVANIMMPMVRPYITASRVIGLLFMKNRVVTPLWMKMGFREFMI